MGDKLRVKIWDSVEKTIGGLILPWQLKRVGRANAEVRRHDALMSAQIEGEIEALRSGQIAYDTKSGRFLPKPSTVDVGEQEVPDQTSLLSSDVLSELVARAQEKAAIDQLKREINLMRVVHIASEEAGNLDEPPSDQADKAVEPDWIRRWQSSAENVSSDDVQQLWGKILAGEVNRPGSFSLRTLTILSQITSSDARLVERIGPLVLEGSCLASVFPTRFGEQKFGISMEDLMVLDELGLLVASGMGGLQLTIGTSPTSDFEATIRLPGQTIVLKSADPNLELKLPIINLTAAGRQLVTLGHFQANHEYIDEIARRLRRDGLKIHCGTPVQLPDGRIALRDYREIQ